MKVCIVGGSGAIGSALVRYYLCQGDSVINLHNKAQLSPPRPDASRFRETCFAKDVGPVLKTIKNLGVHMAVLSDIHVDIRSAFERAGLLSLIDLFVLSFEHGVQKPRPEMFQLALEGLNLPASQVLMVGDRAAYDGAAVGEGIATLLLPALRSVTDCRLQLVTALLE